VPAFDTPGPISLAIELAAGNVRISADERADTVVEVRPSDRTKQADVAAAEQTLVEYASGRLSIKATGRWRAWRPFGNGGSVEVTAEVPAGSGVTATLSLGTFRCTGALGDCRIKAGAGDIQVEDAGAAKLKSAAGDIELGRTTGDAELVAASGDVRANMIDGAAAIKSSSGDIGIGEVTGEVSVKAANGDIAIERAHASIVAKTANGNIRVGAAERGSVVAETGVGGVEIGILEGSAAWLDLHTGYGRLRNHLDPAGPPEPGADTVQLRARTGYGDVTVSRCHPPASIAFSK